MSTQKALHKKHLKTSIILALSLVLVGIVMISLSNLEGTHFSAEAAAIYDDVYTSTHTTPGSNNKADVYKKQEHGEPVFNCMTGRMTWEDGAEITYSEETTEDDYEHALEWLKTGDPYIEYKNCGRGMAKIIPTKQSILNVASSDSVLSDEWIIVDPIYMLYRAHGLTAISYENKRIVYVIEQVYRPTREIFEVRFTYDRKSFTNLLYRDNIERIPTGRYCDIPELENDPMYVGVADTGATNGPYNKVGANSENA